MNWFEKLKSLVPGWVTGRKIDAIFNGMAQLLAGVQENLIQFTRETFIDTAQGGYLDLIGEGRGIAREQGEQDGTYRERVRLITNNSSCVAIARAVTRLLASGTATVFEDFSLERFVNRGSFVSRGAFLTSERARNSFYVIIPSQRRPSTSFVARGSFVNRSVFTSALEFLTEILRNIIKTVNSIKAFGVQWRLLVRKV